MKTITITLFLFFSCFAFSQVGVGNTDPKSTLDISASSTTSPTNEDGILIPRIDNFPTTDPTADQDGMMVFATGNGTPTKGFYYWDNGSGTWVSVLGAREINDLADGKSEGDVSSSSIFLGFDSGLNDDGSNYNIGIGRRTLRSNTSGAGNIALGASSLINNTTGIDNVAIGAASLVYNNIGANNISIGKGANYFNQSGNDNVAIGSQSLTTGNSKSFNVAIGGLALNTTTGNNNVGIGYSAGRYNNGSYNVFLGSHAGQSESGSHKLYIENTSANENNALVYGEFDNDILRTNGEFQIGNPTLTGYAFPLIDGTAGQVMTTDGAGNVTFQNALSDDDWREISTSSSPDDINDNQYTLGKVNIGANTLPSATLSITNDDSADRAGLNVSRDLTTTGTGGKYGIESQMVVSGSNNYTGILSSFLGSTINQSSNAFSTNLNSVVMNNDFTAYSTTFSGNTGTGELKGIDINYLSNVTNTGDKYGADFYIDENTAGIHYGIRSRAISPTGYAGFFAGRIQLGEDYTNNRYFMPGADGTAGQVMTTDGAGNVTFQDSNSDADWYEAGTTNSPTNITADIFTQGNVGIGNPTPDSRLDIEYSGTDNAGTILDYEFTAASGIGRGLYINADYTGVSELYGSQIDMGNSGASTRVAGMLINNLGGSDSGEHLGVLTEVTGLGGNYGFKSIMSGSGTNFGFQTIIENGALQNYGYDADITSNYTGATSYGIRTRLTGGRSNFAIYGAASGGYFENYAGFFGDNSIPGSGNVYIQDNLNVDGSFTLTDGSEALGNVLASDASGNANWVNPNSIFSDSDNQQINTFYFNSISNTLTLAIEDDGQPNQIVNLSTLDQSSNVLSNSTAISNHISNDADTVIGNEVITAANLSGTTLQILEAGNTTSINLSALQDGDTQNTLDQAYNEGGAGAGKNITADSGALRINGDDGFLVTGTLGSGNFIDSEVTGVGTRMFFNPNKAAFRAGYVSTNQWDNTNIGSYSVAFGSGTTASGEVSSAFGAFTIASGQFSMASGAGTTASGQTAIASGTSTTASGDYSTAFGYSTLASGNYSTVFGNDNTASGRYSSVFGNGNTAPSAYETVIGINSTNYTPNSTTSFNNNDRLFVVGNGSMPTMRSNALTIYKDGRMTINDAYTMPTIDGTTGQVMTTDGAGNVTFQNPTTNTDDQQIDNLGLVGTLLGISLEDDGVPPATVDLASINTDNQQIDNFSFNSSTNILTLEIEEDGQAAQTVDLSSLNPTKSVARIYMLNPQSETGGGVTKVNFDTVEFDTNSDFNTTTNEFTVPADGIYRVTAQITFTSNTGTGAFGVRVRVDGTQERRSEYNHHGNGEFVRQVTSILYLTTGQTLDVAISRPSVGATIDQNARATFFEIEQIQ